MLLLMRIGDPEKGQFILVDTSEATEENENTTHVSIKGIFTSPFLKDIFSTEKSLITSNSFAMFYP